MWTMRLVCQYKREEYISINIIAIAVGGVGIALSVGVGRNSAGNAISSELDGEQCCGSSYLVPVDRHLA
jgi:hypothetical protein